MVNKKIRQINNIQIIKIINKIVIIMIRTNKIATTIKNKNIMYHQKWK